MAETVPNPKRHDTWAPEAPNSIERLGIAAETLSDLALKTAYTSPNLTSDSAARRLCVPIHIVQDVLDELKRDRLVEILGSAGSYYRYAITDRGRERASRLLEISGYVGPAPVPVEAYTSMLEWQLAQLPPVSHDEVVAALADLVLPPAAIEIAGLAASSARSLFIHGPPGNGKTTLGHLIHAALRGVLWIPHCVVADDAIIRIFDPHCHDPVREDLEPGEAARVDHRWVAIGRPLVVAAGELTIDSLDMSYSRARGYYEAPMHVKANGGTFLLDDFGRQRVEPHQLLNRWVFPLEHGYDYLTLHTGQKISMPFRQMLIVCTNLDPHEVMDPAFLRRMGYRLYLDNPTPGAYGEMLLRHAKRNRITVPPGLVERLLQRYAIEDRPLRGCEPRDLVDRARDFCTFRGLAMELSDEVIDLAWRGYFGEKDRLA